LKVWLTQLDEIINSKTAKINVKKLHFIHMLTATDDRSSHIKNSKNKSYFTKLLHIDG